jgi:hypothetical protein
MPLLRCENCYTEIEMQLWQLKKAFAADKKKPKDKRKGNVGLPCPEKCGKNGWLTIVKF